MADRDDQIRGFVDQTDWAGANTAPLAGDASNRRYLRLTLPTGETAVVMDAPPVKGEDVRPFVRIARYLTDHGFSAPLILAADEHDGFLLIEDLGDDLFARILSDDPSLEIQLYTAATDVLVSLHNTAPPHGLPHYSPSVMTDLSALVFDWYLDGLDHSDTALRTEFNAAMNDALSTYAPDADVLIQRDYHAENLLWLPERSGVARVGLLDFQDAMLGHRAYDLVSLLRDARRDVTPEVEAVMLDHYIRQSGVESETFIAAYHCLGAQRNLRILGVFARLCLRDGKSHYVDLIPRVWEHLQRDFDHPAIAKVANILRPVLGQPTDETLQKLKSQCATIPHR